MAQDEKSGRSGPANPEPPAGPPARADLMEAPEHWSPERRRFFGRIAAGIAGLAAVVLAVPWLVFLLSPAARRDPRVWRAVGRVQDFVIGETVHVQYMDPDPLPWAGFAARSAAWLRRESEDGFAAFTVYCTHVGCPVRWDEGAELFLCPCHGGVFTRDGHVEAGPPIRPLDRFPVRVREGVVEIQAAGVPVPRRAI